ncbi:MAG: YfhO family protein, partial [Candidatus Goldiibacteriota bacterium]
HLFSFPTALKFFILSSYFIMASFMYKFLESCGISKEGAFSGATVFAFGFYTVIKAPEMAELSTLVWLPAALYFIKKYFLSKKPSDMVFTAFALSLSLLGGHPQFFIYCWLIFAAFYAYLFFIKKRDGAARATLDFFIIHLIFAAVTAIQWVPTLRFLLNSKRFYRGFELAQIIGSYMNYTQILNFICPIFGMALPERDNFMNWAGKIDVGIAGLMLLPLGASALKDKKLRIMLLAVFAAVLFLAYLGTMPFFIPLYEHFKFIGIIRYPSRIIVIGYFILCYFIAAGFDSLFSRPAAELKKYPYFAAAVFVFFAAVYFAVLYNKNYVLRLGMDLFNVKRNFQDVYDSVEQYAFVMNDFFLFVLLCGVSAAAFTLAAMDKYRGAVMKYTALALVVISVLVFNKTGYDSFGNYEWSSQDTSQMKFLSGRATDGRIRVLAPNVINPFDFVPDLDGLKQWAYYAADTLTPNAPMSYGIYNSDGFDSLFLGSYHEFTSGLMLTKAPWRSRAFALLSARYIASSAIIKDPELKTASRGYSIIYETKNYFERAFFLDDGVNTARLNEARGRELLLKHDFDPAKTLILDEHSPLIKATAAAPENKAEVSIKNSPDVNIIDVFVRNSRPGWLVATDNYYPGWKVYVDSVEKNLLRAYTTFKAVHIEAGEHRVIFKYSPPEFAAGLTASFAALFLAALFLAFHTARKKGPEC